MHEAKCSLVPSFVLLILSTVIHLYVNVHAVSCSKVSMNESLFCKVLHSLCYINAHLNQDLQLYTLDREDSKTNALTHTIVNSIYKDF